MGKISIILLVLILFIGCDNPKQQQLISKQSREYTRDIQTYSRQKECDCNRVGNQYDEGDYEKGCEIIFKQNFKCSNGKLVTWVFARGNCYLD